MDLIRQLKNDKKRISYLLLFLGCGILMMLLSSPSTNQDDTQEENTEYWDYSIEREEKRLEAILSSINGVGKCEVLLSIHSGAEIILAEDDGETVVLSDGGKQSAVTVQTRYPAFQGAVIVTGGCDDPSVRYDILSSVMSYTGLGVDRITICPIKVS